MVVIGKLRQLCFPSTGISNEGKRRKGILPVRLNSNSPMKSTEPEALGDLPTLVAEPVKGFELQDAYFWPVEMLDAFRYQRKR